MGHTTRSTRRWLAGAAGVSLIASGLAISGSASATAPAVGTDADAESKVSSTVSRQLEDSGSTDVWLRFDARADLGQFTGLDWTARGRAVYDALTANADASQSAARAELDAAGVEYETFFIANTIFVEDADAELIAELTTDRGLSSVIPDGNYALIEPTETITPGPMAIAWGVDAINAPDVWAEYSDGEGITVATIDSGVQYDHPALVGSYRGNDGDGTFTHDYNWFDAAGSSPEVPDDGNGHGTHVTGTITGNDGGENEIGVAPGATWIATNGCCPSDEALLESMEWILAPTDLEGANPDPDQRPHIVNNSWGSTVPNSDPFGEEIQEAWAAAGVFGTWANGNSGPGCETSGSPGSRTINYSTGGFAEDGSIYAGGSRGPGQDGEIKPNISAPGVRVYSSVPGDGYGLSTGTSMASPHVAGSVALLWSSVPDLVGDVEGTRDLLNGTAIDTDPVSDCGGDTANNNDWGQGKLDALALVEAADVPEPPTAEVERVEGLNRWVTAAAISALFPDGVSTVYIANAEESSQGADALPGGAAAARGAVDFVPNATPDGEPAPILLTKAGSVPAATWAALEALAPANVVVLGGDQVVSETVVDAIEEETDADVTRIEGEDRYDTAANLAREYDPGLETVYVATGQGDTAAGEGLALADALTAASLAGGQGAPVLLTRSEGLPADTVAALEYLEPEAIVLVGGVEAVQPQVETALAAIAPTTRLGGDDRYETAALMLEGYETDGDVLYVASGLNFPDALAVSSLSGSQVAPLVIVNHTVPSDIEAIIRELSPQGITVVGGTSAVSGQVQEQLQVILDDTSAD